MKINFPCKSFKIFFQITLAFILVIGSIPVFAGGGAGHPCCYCYQDATTHEDKSVCYLVDDDKTCDEVPPPTAGMSTSEPEILCDGWALTTPPGYNGSGVITSYPNLDCFEVDLGLLQYKVCLGTPGHRESLNLSVCTEHL
jgi:hypothetical protein